MFSVSYLVLHNEEGKSRGFCKDYKGMLPTELTCELWNSLTNYLIKACSATLVEQKGGKGMAGGTIP